jgi:NAD(P)-dependent dehydrogenase (short-subunit alcohol dehydrogenase family)
MPRRPANPNQGCAWVTGASSGIGAALCVELAKRGWRVAGTARNEESLRRLAEEANILSAPGDVTDRSSLQAAADTVRSSLGPIGLLVCNAGVYLPVDARCLDADDFKKTFDVNVLGAAHALEIVAPDLVRRGTGHVHIVASATGFGGMPTASAYGASKAALINMAECLKLELDRCGVGVSLSTPGFVDTPAQTDNAFPKPFMISAKTAARRIADGMESGGFETTFPKRFTWPLKAIYALPRPWRLPLIRKQTGWAGPCEPPSPKRSTR